MRRVQGHRDINASTHRFPERRNAKPPQEGMELMSCSTSKPYSHSGGGGGLGFRVEGLGFRGLGFRGLGFRTGWGLGNPVPVLQRRSCGP